MNEKPSKYTKRILLVTAVLCTFYLLLSLQSPSHEMAQKVIERFKNRCEQGTNECKDFEISLNNYTGTLNPFAKDRVYKRYILIRWKSKLPNEDQWEARYDCEIVEKKNEKYFFTEVDHYMCGYK